MSDRAWNVVKMMKNREKIKIVEDFWVFDLSFTETSLARILARLWEFYIFGTQATKISYSILFNDFLFYLKFSKRDF